jgi:hypothetical protein
MAPNDDSVPKLWLGFIKYEDQDGAETPMYYSLVEKFYGTGCTSIWILSLNSSIPETISAVIPQGVPLSVDAWWSVTRYLRSHLDLNLPFFKVGKS